jgi:tRNA pseudouridine55 synthase
VLPIALGEATKTVPYVVEGSKEYRFTVRFGAETDTDDAMGKVVARSDRRPTRAEIEAKLPDFTGEIDQVPPRFSALKVDGARAYDLAREEEGSSLSAARVDCKLTLVDHPDTDHCVLGARCSRGPMCGRSPRRPGARPFGHVERAARVGAFGEERAVALTAHRSPRVAATKPWSARSSPSRPRSATSRRLPCRGRMRIG